MNGLNIACDLHKRPIEGFCQECHSFICSSCLFGIKNVHKNHNLITLNELALFLRDLMNENIKLIKPDFCDNRQIEIRQNIHNFESQTKALIQKVNDVCDQLTNLINKRKERLISEINHNYDTELAKLKENEEKWSQNKKLTKALNQLQIDENDINIINNKDFIYTAIDQLSTPVKTIEYKAISDFKENLLINDKVLHLDELINALNESFIVGDDDFNMIPYKA